MINASLRSILTGSIKPRIRVVLDDCEYFEFHNGQVRRQVGQGHSRLERRYRKVATRLQEHLGARRAPAGLIAAGMIARHHQEGGRLS